MTAIAAIAAIYAAFLAIGWWASRRDRASTVAGFMVAGRAMPLWLATFTMTATWVDGGYLLGTAEGVYRSGMAAGLQGGVCFGISLILGGLFFARRMRALEFHTLIDPFEARFGARWAVVLALPAVLAEMFWSAELLVALGSTFGVMLDIDLVTAIVFSAVVVTVYTMAGGMWAVAYTDAFQLTLVGVGLAVSLPFALDAVGGIAAAWNSFAASRPDGVYPVPPLSPSGAWTRQSIVGWWDVSIMLMLGGIPWNCYFQRVLSCRSAAHARAHSILSGLMTMALTVPPLLMGLVASAYVWNGEAAALLAEQPAHALPMIFKHLTPPLVGLLGLAAIIGAVTSSFSSSILSAGSMFSWNVCWRLMNPDMSLQNMKLLMRAAILTIGVGAVWMAIEVQSVQALWFFTSDLVFVLLFPQLVSALFDSKANLAGSVAAFVVSLILRIGGGEPLFGIPALIPYPDWVPFKTLAAGMGLVLLPVVSRLTGGWIVPRPLRNVSSGFHIEAGFSVPVETQMYHSRMKKPIVLAFVAVLVAGLAVHAQQTGLVPAPDRRPGEGVGPFPTLTIRNVMVIDGTGAPPFGPANVIVENNRIARIVNAGTPGVPSREPAPAPAPNIIDGTGMFLMPGFVNVHAHLGDEKKAPQNEYVYKLYMAHGVTTIRGVELTAQPMALREKERSAKNEIVAPRIYNYQRPGAGWGKGVVDTPEKAREWVQWCAANGVDGMKLVAYPPHIMSALLDEAKKHGLGSTAHLEQRGVAQMDALTAAKMGLGTVTHFYGHFEPLLRDFRVQPWPEQMNYNDEQYRFGQVARLWNMIHPPGSDEWKAYLQEHLKLRTVFDPTMTAYAAGRDVMRMRNADWHDKYTLPSLMDFYTPNRENHGSYFFDWTHQDEIAWRNFYQVWFRLLNDYKKMGGRVTVSDDAAYIYNTWGFGVIHEMELLLEAGFHPLEVFRAATMHGAEALHEPKGQLPQFGIVRAGLLADMVLVDQNPLQNIKVLYGTGHLRLNDRTGQMERVGGIRYTIKDGIVYDAKKLLADVAAMVEAQKRQRTSKTSR